jgi:hypothetical protein
LSLNTSSAASKAFASVAVVKFRRMALAMVLRRSVRVMVE